jgi:polyphenol oxidase
MKHYITSGYLDTDKSTKHGFFNRMGGVSSGIYASLNCGTHSHDNAQNVMTNRNIAVQSLSIDAKLVELHQTHSNLVHIIYGEYDYKIPKADAVVTNQKHLALSIVTADCAPVLFSDDKAHVIAAAHAGWKGAFNNIVENTLNAMCKLGASRQNIKVAIGPCIAQNSYEVGAEFYQTISDERFFNKSVKLTHYMFNLEDYIVDKLILSRISQIDTLSLDTYSVKNDYFSYRRMTHKKENDYGRQISLILLK